MPARSKRPGMSMRTRSTCDASRPSNTVASKARADWDPDATFVPGSDEEGGGRWVQHRPVPAQWPLSLEGVRFNSSLTPFRHLAFFPDMTPQWDWMRKQSNDADVHN